MSRDKVAVCIPSIPPRRPLLHRAIDSVLRQTHPVDAISVVIDHDRKCVPEIRHRALMAIDAKEYPWVCFLDDDDEFLPMHVDSLMRHAHETRADYVYSWYKLVLRNGVVTERETILGARAFGTPFDPKNPQHTTITILIRTELAQSIGFCDVNPDGSLSDMLREGEDFRFTLHCIDAGAKIVHLPQRTWLWHHDSKNTSGRADRW